MEKYRRLPTICAAITILIGLTVAMGWAFDIMPLKSILSQYVTMKVNTALCFIFASTAVFFTRSNKPALRIAIYILCTIVAATALLTLAEYFWAIDFGIDQFFVMDAGDKIHRFPPGRLAPITAVNFILVSLSLSIANLRTTRAIWLSQLLASAVLLLAFQSVIGYVTGATSFFGTAFYTKMAMHTAGAFFFLSLGVVLLFPEDGFVSVFSKKNRLSRTTFSILLASVIIPTGVRVLALLGRDQHFYDQDFAQLIQVVATTGLMVLMTIVAGTAMMRSERDRRAVDESEMRFQTLCESMTQLAWIARPDGHIHWYNKRWYEYTGKTFAQMEGWGWQNVHHPDHVENVIETAKKSWSKGDAWELTFPLKRADGEFRWFLTRIVPVKDASGNVRQWLGTNTDIHEQKIHADQMQIAKDLAEKARGDADRARLVAESAKDDAQRANYLKTAFLTNMSHEIRTPLGAMIGFADLMKDPGLTPSERSNFINILLRNGDQLSHLINDILDLSKVESGHLTLEYIETDHRRIGSDVVSLMQVNAKEKDLALEYSYDPSTPEIIISDPARVRQILLNLVGNAIKFTQFGSVEIHTSKCVTDSGRTALCFTVRDTGMGISEAQLPKLFQTFSQADDSITRRFGGTGLGLALSKKLAVALGGDVTVVQTQEGVGSTFLLKVADLPELRSAAEDTFKVESRAVAALPNKALRGLKILVVDDAPDNQQLIWRYLTREGAAVESAENGLLGYRMALKGSYDLVLMDIQMPIMDGYTATQKLRESGYTKPIIALTAHAMNDIRKRALGVGYSDHLTKPIQPNELVSTIVRLTNHMGRDH